MAFTDDFNRTSATLEASPVASGGGSWAFHSGTPNQASLTGSYLKSNANSGPGACYVCPDQGSQDHYVEVTFAPGNSADSFAACRIKDNQNYVGMRVVGTTLEVYRRTAGNMNELSTQTVTAGGTWRMEIVGTQVWIKRNGVTQAGYPKAHGSTDTLTRQGFIIRNVAHDFLDSFEAGSMSTGIAGSDSITEAGDTVSATGALLISGSASVTEAGDTLASASGLAIQAALSATDAGDVVSAVGALALTGGLSVAEGGDTLAASGELRVSGAVILTAADDTLVAAGALAITGALAGTLDDDTLAAVGGFAVRGTLILPEDGDTLTASGKLAIKGTASLTEAGDTLAATAVLTGDPPPPGDGVRARVHLDGSWVVTTVKAFNGTTWAIVQPRVSDGTTWA